MPKFIYIKYKNDHFQVSEAGLQVKKLLARESGDLAFHPWGSSKGASTEQTPQSSLTMLFSGFTGCTHTMIVMTVVVVVVMMMLIAID